VFLSDRGGLVRLGHIEDVTNVQWDRRRDDVSECTINILFESDRCKELAVKAEPVRHELVVERKGQRVWEGPITYKNIERGKAVIRARDPLFFAQRTVCKSKYSSAFRKDDPNRPEKVTSRIARIYRREMQAWEDAGANILKHMVVVTTASTAKTTRVTPAYSQYVWDDMENLAARGGLDYTMVLRSLYLHDTHQFLGRGRTLVDADFLDSLAVTSYGVELSIGSFTTDNNGKHAEKVVADKYYGPVELLASAYQYNETDKVTVKELQEQAVRNARNRYPVPMQIRVPQNVTMNPDTVDELMPFMVPGVAFPVETLILGEPYSAVQKLDRVTVEEGPDGEQVRVIITNAPVGSGIEELIEE